MDTESVNGQRARLLAFARRRSRLAEETMEDDRMPTPISPVAIRNDTKLCLSLWNSCLYARKAFYVGAISAISFMALQGHALAATYAVNVNLPSAILQKDFVAGTTTQYLGTLTPSAFFPNTYNLTITGHNPNYVPPASSTPTVGANDLLQALVSISSSTYPYGWADGEDYAHFVDLKDVVGFQVLCSSTPAFAMYGSTDTWNEQTCRTALKAVHDDIYSIRNGTVTVVPGY